MNLLYCDEQSYGVHIYSGDPEWYSNIDRYQNIYFPC